MNLKIGIRWDDESQNARFIKAKKMGLIDYIEVNYPIAPNEKPHEVDLPIYAHSAYNGICSAFGLNENLVNIIKNEADKYSSPWIGEHLSWIAPAKEGAIGYVFNTIYNQEYLEVTIENINTLKRIYNRPIALELGPQYALNTDGLSDIEFQIKAAQSTNSHIILDLSHLLISNHNLNRNLDFGLDEYKKADTIELHIAGIRKSNNSEFWHDCHDILPDKSSLALLGEFCKNNDTLKAVTFEHSTTASEESFFQGLEAIHKAVGASYA